MYGFDRGVEVDGVLTFPARPYCAPLFYREPNIVLICGSAHGVESEELLQLGVRHPFDASQTVYRRSLILPTTPGQFAPSSDSNPTVDGRWSVFNASIFEVVLNQPDGGWPEVTHFEARTIYTAMMLLDLGCAAAASAACAHLRPAIRGGINIALWLLRGGTPQDFFIEEGGMEHSVPSVVRQWTAKTLEFFHLRAGRFPRLTGALRREELTGGNK
jgi:hypothetical protein